jgi:hypothetical protein
MIFKIFYAVLILNSIHNASSFTTPLQPSESYTNTWTVNPLDANEYRIYWKRIGTDQIQFELHCRTLGWVGFGISADGTMRGADITLGWVKNGAPFLYDMFSQATTTPRIDVIQDVTLLASVEVNGYTIFKFSRKLDTGDTREDRVITNSPQIFIAAFYPEDPVTGNGDWLYHERNRRWSFTTNLLG